MDWGTPEQLLMGAGHSWLLRSLEVLGGWSMAKFEFAKQKLMVAVIEIVPFLGVSGLLASMVCSDCTLTLLGRILSSVFVRPVQTFSHTFSFFVCFFTSISWCWEVCQRGWCSARLYWRERERKGDVGIGKFAKIFEEEEKE